MSFGQFFSPPRLLEESKPYWAGANTGMLTQRGAATLAGMLSRERGISGFAGPFVIENGSVDYKLIKVALTALGYNTSSYYATIASWNGWCSSNGFQPSRQAVTALVVQGKNATFWNAKRGIKPGRQVSGLGDTASDIVSVTNAVSNALSTPITAPAGALNQIFGTLGNGVTNALDAISGTTAQAAAEQNAIALAQTQAQEQLLAQQERAASLQAALPWIAGAILGLGAIVVFAGRGHHKTVVKVKNH